MPTRRPPPAADAEAGDLRQRILDTSRALLAEVGVAGLSLREVARRAGVTHQAPYHHFADRESILAELVAQGFDDLARRLAKALAVAAARAGAAAKPNDRIATLVASGLAYVGFALDQPGVFRVMFRSDLCDLGRFEAAQQAGKRAYDELLHLVQLMQITREGTRGLPGAPPDETVAAVVWAQVHGLAMLLLDSQLGQQFISRRARLDWVRGALTLFATQMLAPAAIARRAP